MSIAMFKFLTCANLIGIFILVYTVLICAVLQSGWWLYVRLRDARRREVTVSALRMRDVGGIFQ